MAERKRSAMTINKSGGKEFEPDPLLDEKGTYDARIVGYAHIGTHEKDEYKDGKKTGNVLEVEQCLIAFELTDEETFVDRGPEDDQYKAPRVMFKWEKFSSHEKSNLFKIAKAANPDAVWIEKGQGQVDPLMILNAPVMIKLKNNKDDTNQNISEVNEYPAKFIDKAGEAQSDTFMFSVAVSPDLFEECDIDLAKVPDWILNKATDALDTDEFACLEAIEDQIDANTEAREAAKSDKTKLEGDDKPSKKSEKKAEKKEEPKTEQSSGEEEKEEKPTRSRRSRRAKAETVDYSGKSVEELEDLLIEKGKSDDDLDEIAGDLDDDAYKEAMIEVLNSL